MKHKKKILFLLIVVLIFLFPEQIFSGFAGIMILLLVLFLVVEVALDIYIDGGRQILCEFVCLHNCSTEFIMGAKKINSVTENYRRSCYFQAKIV